MMSRPSLEGVASVSPLCSTSSRVFPWRSFHWIFVRRLIAGLQPRTPLTASTPTRTARPPPEAAADCSRANETGSSLPIGPDLLGDELGLTRQDQSGRIERLGEQCL